MASLSKEEKERILKALEEDHEFRYAMMGCWDSGSCLRGLRGWKSE